MHKLESLCDKQISGARLGEIEEMPKQKPLSKTPRQQVLRSLFLCILHFFGELCTFFDELCVFFAKNCKIL